MILVAKGIAGGDVLDADDGGDVAGVTGIDVRALVGLNLDQAGDALALVGARIVNGVALAERAGIDAEEDELADEGIAPELEREGAELAVVIGGRIHGRVGIRVHALGRRDVDRAGEVIDDGIHEVLDALVLESGTADDRHELVRDGLPADACLENFGSDRLFLEEIHADFLIEIGDGGDEVVVGFIDDLLMVGGDLLDHDRSSP